MINSYEEAVAVQTRRHISGKRGTAKAVRRFIQRTDPANYERRRTLLPITWPPKYPPAPPRHWLN